MRQAAISADKKRGIVRGIVLWYDAASFLLCYYLIIWFEYMEQCANPQSGFAYAGRDPQGSESARMPLWLQDYMKRTGPCAGHIP